MKKYLLLTFFLQVSFCMAGGDDVLPTWTPLFEGALIIEQPRPARRFRDNQELKNLALKKERLKEVKRQKKGVLQNKYQARDTKNIRTTQYKHHIHDRNCTINTRS